MPLVQIDDALGMDGRCSKLLQKRSTNLVRWALDAAGREKKETVAKLLLAPWALLILWPKQQHSNGSSIFFILILENFI